MSRSTVGSLDESAPTPRLRLSDRFARASRASRAFQSRICCLRFCARTYAIAGVGLKPIPLRPVPSSSGSLVGPVRWPVISLSCHVSTESGGEGDFARRRGCNVLDADPDPWAKALDFLTVFVVEEDTKAVGCARAAISERMRGCVRASGVPATSLDPRCDGLEVASSFSALLSKVLEFAIPLRCSASDVPLSTCISSSFGFFRTTWSLGESGLMGMAEMCVRLMPRSWSAMPFLGLSLPSSTRRAFGGGEAGRRAVLMCGIGGG